MNQLKLFIDYLSENIKLDEAEKRRLFDSLPTVDIYELKTYFYKKTINIPKNFDYDKISSIPNGIFNDQEIVTKEITPPKVEYTKGHEKKFNSMTDFLNELSNAETTDSRIKFIKDTKFCFNLYFGIEPKTQFNNPKVYTCLTKTKTNKYDYIIYKPLEIYEESTLLSSFNFIMKFHKLKTLDTRFDLFQREISNLINKLKLSDIVPDFKFHSFYNLVYIIILTNEYDANIETNLKKVLIKSLNSEKIIKILNLFSKKFKIITLADIHERKNKGTLNDYMKLLITESDKIKITVPCYCNRIKIFFQQEDFGVEKKITLYI
jgi:hypothetical protein